MPQKIRALMASAIAAQFLGLAEAFRYFIMGEGSAVLTWISLGVGLFLTVIALDVLRRRVTTVRDRLKLAGKISLFYVLMVSVVALGFVQWERYLRPRYEALRDSPPKTLYIRVPPPAELRAFLAQPENFQVQATVSAITGPVRAAFTKGAHQESFAMAEPGADWQETDVISEPGLPFYRLGKVALSRALCILFYEQGGFGWMYHVDVFQITPNGATLVWRAHSPQTIAGPSDLLTIIDSGKFVAESSP